MACLFTIAPELSFGLFLQKLWLLSALKFLQLAFFQETLKPKNMDFMNEFIDELKTLVADGLFVEEVCWQIELQCFCADAPARAFLKGIISHNGYFGCEKCTTKGEHIRNTVFFNQLNATLRTDETFRLKQNPQHHVSQSPLTEFVGMVTQFPYDYMHLVCLGVARRLLNNWTHGPSVTGFRKRDIPQISESLLSIRALIPSEFSRKTRSLKDLAYWKATELRLFLLYVGPLVLEGFLSEERLDHFMLLHVAISILVDPYLCNSLAGYAKELLHKFLKVFRTLYPSSPIVYNLHSLSHLVDDVLRYGSLDNFSCFGFESYLNQLKALVRGTKNPLKQAAHRLLEKQENNFSQENNKKKFSNYQFLKEHNEGPIHNFAEQEVLQYKILIFQNLRFSIDAPDNCIQFGRSIGLILNILKEIQCN